MTRSCDRLRSYLQTNLNVSDRHLGDGIKVIAIVLNPGLDARWRTPAQRASRTLFSNKYEVDALGDRALWWSGSVRAHTLFSNKYEVDAPGDRALWWSGSVWSHYYKAADNRIN